jgi:two-component system, response regulator RegA
MTRIPGVQTSAHLPEKNDVLPRVLLVDDETAILFAYRRLMGKIGYLADCCETLEEAVRLIETRAYTFVIADMRLAGSDTTAGLDLLRFIRVRQPGTKVIIWTGYGTRESEAAILALGAAYYFEKPVLPSIILDILTKLQERG